MKNLYIEYMETHHKEYFKSLKREMMKLENGKTPMLTDCLELVIWNDHSSKSDVDTEWNSNQNIYKILHRYMNWCFLKKSLFGANVEHHSRTRTRD